MSAPQDLSTVRRAQLYDYTGDEITTVGVSVTADGALLCSLTDDEAERTYAVSLLDGEGVTIAAVPVRCFPKES